MLSIEWTMKEMREFAKQNGLKVTLWKKRKEKLYNDIVNAWQMKQNTTIEMQEQQVIDDVIVKVIKKYKQTANLKDLVLLYLLRQNLIAVPKDITRIRKRMEELMELECFEFDINIRLHIYFLFCFFVLFFFDLFVRIQIKSMKICIKKTKM